MPTDELIHTFSEPLRAADGALYAVRAFGRARQDGTWEGWLAFSDASGVRWRTERETTQSSAEQVAYWARGLETTYLEGALARAQRG